jgi:hypothetical protein
LRPRLASDEGSFVLPFFMVRKPGMEIAAIDLAVPEHRTDFMRAV